MPNIVWRVPGQEFVDLHGIGVFRSLRVGDPLFHLGRIPHGVGGLVITFAFALLRHERTQTFRSGQVDVLWLCLLCRRRWGWRERQPLDEKPVLLKNLTEIVFKAGDFPTELGPLFM